MILAARSRLMPDTECSISGEADMIAAKELLNLKTSRGQTISSVQTSKEAGAVTGGEGCALPQS
jgi:hypothetical protein